MTERTTKGHVESAFRALCEAVGKREATDYNDVGAWRLDHAGSYGGWKAAIMNCRNCNQPIKLGETADDPDWIHDLRAPNASPFTGRTPCKHAPGSTVAEPPELALFSWTVAHGDPSLPPAQRYRSKLVASYSATDDAKARYHAERDAAERKRRGYENVHIFHDGPVYGKSEAKTGWAPLYVFTFAERFLAGEVIDTYSLGKWWRDACPHKPYPDRPLVCQLCRELMPD